MRTSTAPSGATVTESDDLISLTWSWVDKYDDFERDFPHEVIWIKGDNDLIFRSQRPDGVWQGLVIRHPDYHPTSEATAREMALKFIAAGGAT